MLELIKDSDTLTPLYESEIDKCKGILNGIDAKLWDPRTDSYLDHHLKGTSRKNWSEFKSKNKFFLQEQYKLKSERPLIGFIGRFAYQKGADLFLEAITEAYKQNLEFNTIILGSGDKDLENMVVELSNNYPKKIAAEIAYNEQLARHIYAGSDFLIMPSRFEPCGLNQLYAMRYGTVPIVSHVGGLKDTVKDVSKKGEGIVLQDLNVEEIVHAIQRSKELYHKKNKFSNLINSISKLDYSWNNSAGIYAKLYKQHSK